MCLGELAEVVQVDVDDTAEVTTSRGRRATVSLMVLDEPVEIGDWLVVHAGFAVERVTAAEALEATRIRAAIAPEDESS